MRQVRCRSALTRATATPPLLGAAESLRLLPGRAFAEASELRSVRQMPSAASPALTVRRNTRCWIGAPAGWPTYVCCVGAPSGSLRCACLHRSAFRFFGLHGAAREVLGGRLAERLCGAEERRFRGQRAS